MAYQKKKKEYHMGAQKQGTGIASAAMMAKFIKDHKRVQVALAGYSVVGIFILSYLLANQVQDWFGRSALSQLVGQLAIGLP